MKPTYKELEEEKYIMRLYGHKDGYNWNFSVNNRHYDTHYIDVDPRLITKLTKEEG